MFPVLLKYPNVTASPLAVGVGKLDDWNIGMYWRVPLKMGSRYTVAPLVMVFSGVVLLAQYSSPLVLMVALSANTRLLLKAPPLQALL